MAVVVDQFVATASRTTFIKPPDLQRQLTPLPRAILNFNVFNAAGTAKPLSDTLELAVAIDLPFTFAYRMIELHAVCTFTALSNWEPIQFLEVTNAIRDLEAGAFLRHPVSIVETVLQSPATPIWLTNPMDVPTYIMQAAQRVAPVLTYRANNQDIDTGGTYVFNFYASFYEYDIEQVQMFPVHAPTQVYARN